MNVTIRLHYDEARLREPSAWFIAGASAELWLVELAGWQSPLHSARLFAVPTSRSDRRPCGVFVLGAAPAPERAGPRTIGYARIAERLYLPLHARCEPDVTDAELGELLDVSDPRLWHPQAGLHVLAAENSFSVADLISPIAAVQDLWQAAQTGTALNSRLLSLEPTAPPTADEVMNSGRGDIATRPPKLDDLPESPGEPQTGTLGAAQRAVERALARTVRGLTGLAPTGAAKPTWVDALQSWAASRLRDISRQDEEARNRELMRLMNLLKNDPDEGLRFALPFGGEAHRGVGAPSNRLSSRDVNYRPGGVGSGGPADHWDVSAEMRRRLMQQYRELAAREIALGRHRRAAYIFAQLLNDLQSAATTLADGGHYRDAAVLYEEKLKRPELAAECLHRGGLRLEAIAIYQRLAKHEVVGDLYAELEQPDDAASAWRRAVDVHRQAGDILGEAKLLEGKLRAPEEAFHALADAWPASQQAQSCLAEAFQTANRIRRHELAARLVDQAAERTHARNAAVLAEILSDQADQYPDLTVRLRATERTQIVVSQRLGSNADDREATRLVAALRKLTPQDRLLERDGHRYLQRRRANPTAASPRHSRGRLTVLHQVMLGMECRAVAATHDAIFVVGVRDGELRTVRLGWVDPIVERPFGKSWTLGPEMEDRNPLLVADPTGLHNLIVHVCGSPPLADLQNFRASDQFRGELGVGPHRGVNALTLGAYRSNHETLHVVDYNPMEPIFVAHTYVMNKMLGGATAVDLLKLSTESFGDDGLTLPLPMVVIDGVLHVGIGANLCLHSAGAPTVVPLPQPIVQLAASAPRTRTRLAAAMQRGGLLFWDHAGGRGVPFASDMERPRVGFTRDGLLLAAGGEELECYKTAESRLVHHGRYQLPRSSPLALLTTRALSRFALVYTDGTLILCETPT